MPLHLLSPFSNKSGRASMTNHMPGRLYLDNAREQLAPQEFPFISHPRSVYTRIVYYLGTVHELLDGIA
jgi:hypothetical protein